jgi:hypothetical protein
MTFILGILFVLAVVVGLAIALFVFAARRFGLLRVMLIIGVLLVVGFSYFALQPTKVGYDDILSHENASTFVAHHPWSDASSTSAVQAAIRRFGDGAYGKTFSELIDDEKKAEDHDYAVAHIASWQTTCEPGSVDRDADGNEVICPNRYPAAKALEVYNACWGPIETRLDAAVSNQRAASIAMNSGDLSAAMQDEDSAKENASAGKQLAQDGGSCPAVFKTALDRASDYFDAEDYYVFDIEKALTGDRAAAAEITRLGNSLDGQMFDVQAGVIPARVSLGLPLRSDAGVIATSAPTPTNGNADESPLNAETLIPLLFATQEIRVSAGAFGPLKSVIVSVPDTPAHGVASANDYQTGEMADGRWVGVVPLESKTDAGTIYALLWVWTDRKAEFIGEVPAENNGFGHLTVGISGGTIVVTWPSYGPGDQLCCPRFLRKKVLTLDGVTLRPLSDAELPRDASPSP